MSAVVTVRPARRALGNVLVVVGLVVALVATLPRPATALDGVLRAATPTALSVLLSQQVVPAGGAEAFLVAPDDQPGNLAGVPAALGALPGPTSLLLSPPGAPSAAVLAEVDRISNSRTVAYVIGDAAVASALQAHGLTVIAIEGADANEIAVALANQTFGVAAGHGQRVVLTGTDLHVAGLANAWAANLGIPVVPAAPDWTSEAFLRQVLIVADPAQVPDSAGDGHPGSPTTTRIFDPSLDALGVALGAALADEPRDGFLEDRVGPATIVLDQDEDDPHPALLASVASAAYALDGLDATVRVQPRAAEAGSTGPTVVLGLTGSASDPPAPAERPPLPATGGGLLVGGLLAAAGLGLRRS